MKGRERVGPLSVSVLSFITRKHSEAEEDTRFQKARLSPMGHPWEYRVATKSVGKGLKRVKRFPVGVYVSVRREGSHGIQRFKNEGPRGESNYMMDRQRHVKPCSPLRFYTHTQKSVHYAKHSHWSIRCFLFVIRAGKGKKGCG